MGCAALWALIVCVAAFGQGANDELLLRSNVRRVLVDVVVTNREGHPVRGLKAEDFRIQEDGAPQEIRSFDAVETPTVGERLASPEELPPNTFTNFSTSSPKAPTNIILLDLVHCDMDDQMRGRQAAVRYVERMPAGQKMAVFVLKDRLHLLQGVTEDKRLVLAAVTSRATWPYFRGAEAPSQVITMYSAFGALAHYMAAIEGRKNLLWLSHEFMSEDRGSLIMEQALKQADGDDINPASERRLHTEIGRFLRAAMQTDALLSISQVAIYPIDEQGLIAPAGGMGVEVAPLMTDQQLKENPRKAVNPTGQTRAGRTTQP